MRYLCGRLGNGLLVLIGVSVLSFLLAELAPGSVFDELKLDPRISAATAAAMRDRYGLDRAFPVKYVDWLQSIAHVPVLLKGILTGDDAARAIDHGAHGIIVSNHGARNLDTVPATIDALPEVAERVDRRVPLLFDGGIRRGTDIVKAIAHGANAVLIGRSYAFALAVDGANGVARAVAILREELETALALLDRASLGDVDRGVLW